MFRRDWILRMIRRGCLLASVGGCSESLCGNWIDNRDARVCEAEDANHDAQGLFALSYAAAGTAVGGFTRAALDLFLNGQRSDSKLRLSCLGP